MHIGLEEYHVSASSIDRNIPAGQLYAVILLPCFFMLRNWLTAFARIVLDT